MCSTFSLLVIEWKLCAHTTSDVQTSKRTQRYTLLACCWYRRCGYCRFVIFQLFFSEIFVKAQKAIFTSVFELTKIFHNCLFLMLNTIKEHYKCIAGAFVYNSFIVVTRCAPCTTFVQVYTCTTVLILPIHQPATSTVMPHNVMYSTFSLCDIEWKL